MFWTYSIAYIIIRGSFGGGGTSTKRGGPQLQKIRVWRDLKLQIFGAEGAENFEKMKGFSGKLALFWSFRGKFGQIWINMVILN